MRHSIDWSVFSFFFLLFVVVACIRIFVYVGKHLRWRMMKCLVFPDFIIIKSKAESERVSSVCCVLMLGNAITAIFLYCVPSIPIIGCAKYRFACDLSSSRFFFLVFYYL